MSQDAEWELRLKNFRVFEDFVWSPLPGVCLLVGSNGSGKTTSLEALEFLKNYSKFGPTDALRLAGGGAGFRRRKADPDSLVEFALKVGDLEWKLQFPVVSGQVGPEPDELVLNRGKVLFERKILTTKYRVDDVERDTGGRSGLEVLKYDKPEIKPLIEFIENAHIYRSYWLNRVTKEVASANDPIKYVHSSGSNIWNVLRNWRASPKRFEDRFEWVMKSIRAAFPALVSEIEIDSFGQTLVPRYYPADAENADDHLPPSRAADGMLVGLLHLTAVAGAERGSVLAFDEMENQLHPFAIRSILRAMRERAEEYDLTIILTTHSPVLMNEFKGFEGQFYLLEPSAATTPIALDQARDPEWLAHFYLGNLYDRCEIGAPDIEPVEE